MDTDKRGYNSYEKAFEELNRILNINYNVIKKKKPSRVYFSDVTKLWHLTSSPTIKIY